MIARKPDFKEDYVFVKTLKRIKNQLIMRIIYYLKEMFMSEL